MTPENEPMRLPTGAAGRQETAARLGQGAYPEGWSDPTVSRPTVADPYAQQPVAEPYNQQAADYYARPAADQGYAPASSGGYAQPGANDGYAQRGMNDGYAQPCAPSAAGKTNPTASTARPATRRALATGCERATGSWA